MTPEQRAAYIMAAAARAMLRMEGMKALNFERESHGKALAYDEQAFLDVIRDEGISENDVLSVIQGRFW